ncbi:unnamed protein product [uncultured bacterium]|nr:unnamed protein product [uncultured bacterium]
MSDLSFKNNVPDPLLSGKELPTFKFELEKSTGKVMGNSFGKEATVEQLPISKGIAGGINATRAQRDARASLAFRTEQLHAGDVGYIPQGFGHSIENVGGKPSRY